MYVLPPKEMANSNENKKVWKLKKAMYGLKQSGRAWNKKSDLVLQSISLQKSKTDPCIYFDNRNKKFLIIAIYVDDLLIFSNSQSKVKAAKHILENNFEMKDLDEVENCLGMCLKKDKQNNKIHINQSKYIETVLEKFGMDKCNPISTPMEHNVKLTKD